MTATILNIAPGVWKCTFGTPEKEVPSQQNYVKTPDLDALRQLPEQEIPPIAIEQMQFSTSPGGCRLELPLSPDEDIYGFGLQLKSLRHTGKKRTLRVNSDPVADTGDSHAPVPIYFSTAGYGVLVDTARYVSFYCGGNRHFKSKTAGRHEQETATVALTEAELYTGARSAAAPMIIALPAAQGVELYLFGGPVLRNAVQRYVLYCGGGCLPPEWGLGVWYRVCGTHDQAKVEAMAEELRHEHIPCDVLGLEPGWQSKAYSCSLTWSKERFPQPKQLLAKLKQQGYRVNLWEHVFVHPSSPLYQPLTKSAGDFEVWDGLVPDLSLAEAQQQFAEYHRKTFTAAGISSFKLDECDNSDFIASPWSFPECAQFPSGKDGEQMHSLLGLLYQETIEQACRSAGIRTYGNVRSSHAWAAPHPFVLYSDLYEHHDFIRGMVGCGFSGMLWTPELRDARSVEDYVRRLQTMVLAPQMLLNIWSMPYPPWRQLQRELNCAGQFLPDGEQQQLIKLTRQILEQRMSFIPYLYSAFAEYHFTGIPPFRALPLDYPDDIRLRDVDYAWLAGPSLLVIPFPAGIRERIVPLPLGNWYDFYTGERHVTEITLRPELATLPILVKDNAIIPLANPMEKVRDGMKYQLTLRLYGNHPEPIRLFVDDGVSYDYEQGRYAWGKIRADGKASPELNSRFTVINTVNMTDDRHGV